MTASVGDRVARGAAWMVAARVTDRLVGLASTLILARVLTPADFGIMAMAMAIIGLIELASAFGFEVTLLREKQPSRAQYDTVWTLNLLFGLACGVATALAASPAAGFYKDDRLVPVVLALAAAWAIGSLQNVGTVDFRRNLDFGKEFRFMISLRAVTVSVTVSCAFAFHSYWALVAGILAGRSAGVLLSYLWHPYRPRLSLAAARELFSFSVWIFVEKVLSFGNLRLGDFVLGRLHGPTEVGVYRLAEEIAYLPGSEVVAPINRALLPGASRLVDSGRRMADVMATATGVVALVLIPSCVGIAAVADPLVRTLLGAQWQATVPIIEIMAFHTLLIALWGTQHTALLAAGLPKIPGMLAAARLIVYAPCVVALAPEFGARGLAIAALVSSTVVVAIGVQVVSRQLSVSTWDYARAIWRPVVASAAMFVLVRMIMHRFAQADGELGFLIQLIAGVVTGVAAYVAVIGLLYLLSGRPAGAERLVLQKLSHWGR